MATSHTLARPRRWILGLRWGSLRWSVFVYACAVVLGFACGFPLLWMASMAFKPPPEVLAWLSEMATDNALILPQRAGTVS